MNEEKEKLEAVAAKLGIGEYHRHVFLCTGPKCCTPEEGMAAWEQLKQELKDEGLLSGPNACYRTKVGCLRICQNGPTMLVYPEGTWYHGMCAEKIPEFVRKHLKEGQPVEEWVFARNPLTEKRDGGKAMASTPIDTSSRGRREETVEERFARLAATWHEAVAHHSSSRIRYEHPAYQEIIGMGLAVIPCLLRDLEANRRHWFAALAAISGANPVRESDVGVVAYMVEAWLRWGRENGYRW